ncbi:MAG: SUMF1/EgtB/PvdO family nonheme iron enzyme [Planctomycetales bacterium]|nr:SUMF1/EgtB/PvdO family nonheme iron enzyme [Planctomycetales bacterium]
MIWRSPSRDEHALLAAERASNPALVDLARVLSLPPRIEPLLIRNARRELVPETTTETESALWFSELITTRNTREAVMNSGIARLLTDELAHETVTPDLEQVWRFTCLHTRHWNAVDRLERNLRYFAITGNHPCFGDALRDLLRLASTTEKDTRIALARLVRRLLPSLTCDGLADETLEAVRRFAALTLGEFGDWTTSARSAATPAPAWLAGLLPELKDDSHLAITLHHDQSVGTVLALRYPEAGEDAIAFPGALPARLHVGLPNGEGQWHTVADGSRIRLTAAASRLTLTTLDGRRWELLSERPAPAATEPEKPLRLRLIHAPEDASSARELAMQLQQHRIDVELQQESDARPLSSLAPSTDLSTRTLRLWTRAARSHSTTRSDHQAQPVAVVPLLRADDAEWPSSDHSFGALQAFDWSHGHPKANVEDIAPLVDALKHWLADDARMAPEIITAAQGAANAHSEDEIAALLAELDNPTTEPPRRLAIGDRLAELGDPRPGVGVREFDVPVELTPEVAALLAELENPGTEPPRRLAIGDELAELGDPRLGVGLDERGLPEIDWVEIPAGPFRYQGEETVELPGFFLARYPITNRQYQSFIDAGGYREGRWWADLKRPEPEESRWSQSNRPRTGVDWYEATAFCRWLSAQRGVEIRLPTEREWERAATGGEGRTYPWGADYRSGLANVDESRNKDGTWNLEQTTAVGVYPHVASAQGVLDLSGNVWEWCANKYDELEKVEADTADDVRMLRGGSWLYNPEFAGASSRLRYRPDSRHHHSFGFRVLSPAPKV